MKTIFTLAFSSCLLVFAALGQNFEKFTLQSLENTHELNPFTNSIREPNFPYNKLISENRSGEDTQDSTLTWYWDAEVDMWDLQNITYYTSDLNNNILSKRTINRDGSQWINSSLESLTYDDFNNLTSQLFQEWVGSEWVNTTQYVFTYDNDNNRTKYLIQNWYGVQWVYHLQFIYTYDTQHHLLNRISQTWQTSEWVNQFNVIHTYDGDLLLSTVAQHWVDEWINQSQSLFSYNDDNLRDTLLNQRYLFDEWVDNQRDIFEYDGSGNQTRILSQLPEGDSSWVDYYQLFYEYDHNNNVTYLLYQENLNDAWENVDLFTAGYDENDNRVFDVYKHWEQEWVNQDSIRHYYTFSTGMEANLMDSKVNIYPNPAFNELTIKCDGLLPNPHLTFLTISGAKAFTTRLNSETVDITNLPAGFYHLLIQSDNEFSCKKFVKL